MEALRIGWGAVFTGTKRLFGAVALLVVIGIAFPPALSVLLLPLAVVAVVFDGCDSGPSPEQVAEYQKRESEFRLAHAHALAFCDRVGVPEVTMQLTILSAMGETHTAADYRLMRAGAKRMWADILDMAVRQLPASFEEPSLPYHVWNRGSTERMRAHGLTDEEIDEMWREARLYARPEFDDLNQEQRIRFIAGQI